MGSPNAPFQILDALRVHTASALAAVRAKQLLVQRSSTGRMLASRR